MKKLLMLCLSLFMAVSLVACGDADKKEEGKTLTVLTSSGYEPYEELDGDGNLFGFDIDLMEACADVLGYEVEWKDMDFDGIIESIKLGKGDVAIAGISPSAERAKVVDFSDAYYAESDDSMNYVITKKDSGITKTADIKGKKVGVQKGTVQESCAYEIEEEYNLTLDARTNNADLIQDVLNGNLDFMILEKAVAEARVAEAKDLVCFRLEAGTDPTGNAMVFAKGSELTAEFNKAIKTLKDNGELDKLIKKYFGE